MVGAGKRKGRGWERRRARESEGERTTGSKAAYHDYYSTPHKTDSRAVRLPSVDGMLPESWLLNKNKCLQRIHRHPPHHNTERLAQTETATHHTISALAHAVISRQTHRRAARLPSVAGMSLVSSLLCKYRALKDIQIVIASHSQSPASPLHFLSELSEYAHEKVLQGAPRSPQNMGHAPHSRQSSQVAKSRWDAAGDLIVARAPVPAAYTNVTP